MGSCYNSSGENNGGLDFGRGRKKWKEVQWEKINFWEVMICPVNVLIMSI